MIHHLRSLFISSTCSEPLFNRIEYLIYHVLYDIYVYILTKFHTVQLHPCTIVLFPTRRSKIFTSKTTIKTLCNTKFPPPPFSQSHEPIETRYFPFEAVYFWKYSYRSIYTHTHTLVMIFLQLDSHY